MNFLSKKKGNGQSPRGEEQRPITSDADRIYALCRRLSLRVSNIESEVSTLRRDHNTMSRKVYREQEAAPTKKKEAVIEELIGAEKGPQSIFPLPFP